jgi:hypothetical protein
MPKENRPSVESREQQLLQLWEIDMEANTGRLYIVKQPRIPVRHKRLLTAISKTSEPRAD